MFVAYEYTLTVHLNPHSPAAPLGVGLAASRAAGGHEEAQDRLGERLAQMELAVGRQLCPVPAHDAPVPQPPAFRHLQNRLTINLHQRAAVLVAAAIQGIPVVSDGWDRAEQPSERTRSSDWPTRHSILLRR